MTTSKAINLDESIDRIMASIKGKSWEEWSNIDVNSEGQPIPLAGNNYSEWGELHAKIKHLVADYIESIELPEELDNPMKAGERIPTDAEGKVDTLYLEKSFANGYNYSLTECQAKLDEAVKELGK